MPKLLKFKFLLIPESYAEWRVIMILSYQSLFVLFGSIFCGKTPNYSIADFGFRIVELGMLRLERFGYYFAIHTQK
jgi:hypothetical protein